MIPGTSWPPSLAKSVSYSFVRDSVSKYKMGGNGEKLWKIPNVNLRIIYIHIHVCIHCVYRRRNGLKSRKV